MRRDKMRVVKMKSVGFIKLKFTVGVKFPRGFTLVELLVVLAVISLLMGILLPALGKVRRQAKSLLCQSNQRQIVLSVAVYAKDNDDWFPESVATIGDRPWRWQEPTMMTAVRERTSQRHRSMGEYLRSYIEDASILFCSCAPRKYDYFQMAWDAGDDWSNPDTLPPPRPDSLSGTYCFYWGYAGYLGEGDAPFRGPQNALGIGGQSKFLVTDYFGLGHWRNKNAYGNGNTDAYGSSEYFTGAGITPGSGVCISAAFWSRLESDGNISLDSVKVKLHAGYTDGHVESYWPYETVPMRVADQEDGSSYNDSGIGEEPGIFYLPQNGLR